MASTGQVRQQDREALIPLRVSSHVVELEILGQRPAEKYDKEIMCDIPDPKAARLGLIPENDEFSSW